MSKRLMHIKLNKRCTACHRHLEFVEEKDGIYVLCRRCRLSVYLPAETAVEYATDFPTLIETMTTTLADMSKRKVKQKGGVWRRRFG